MIAAFAFADDLVVCGDRDAIQCDIDILSDVCCENGVSTDAKKCGLQYHKKCSKSVPKDGAVHEFLLDGTWIPVMDEFGYLGVTVTRTGSPRSLSKN